MKSGTSEKRRSAFAPGEIGQIVLAWVALSIAISYSYAAGGDLELLWPPSSPARQGSFFTKWDTN
ncbi:MAG TPA: hypothetical protein VN739_10170, partial [Nitrososphaerales archaeon]|nr:hypothetical protein [Nitrososphaerales archaeon]